MKCLEDGEQSPSFSLIDDICRCSYCFLQGNAFMYGCLAIILFCNPRRYMAEAEAEVRTMQTVYQFNYSIPKNP